MYKTFKKTKHKLVLGKIFIKDYFQFWLFQISFYRENWFFDNFDSHFHKVPVGSRD